MSSPSRRAFSSPLTDVLFAVTAVLLGVSARLRRRVLDLPAPILERPGAETLAVELERRGQATVRLLRDPMPSTLAGIRVDIDGPSTILNTTGRLQRVRRQP